jgi:carbonic anhydrase/acetyltransferase-like protein (isoleucine patch superfamily)
MGSLMTDTTIIALGDAKPRIAETAFVAPGCRISGDVTLGDEVSIWYNCVLRGDINHIRIGARTNIQDGSTVHCDRPRNGHPGYPTVVGEDCLIGHMVLLHGCTLEDRAFVGMGAIVLNGATIQSDGMLAAGAMLTSGKVVPSGQLWAGRPAKYLRDLTPEEIVSNQGGVRGYVEQARRHRAALLAR